MPYARVIEIIRERIDAAKAAIRARAAQGDALDAAQPAPVRDYPPLPDFDTVEQHIYGACRRYITQDMLEPIHNLIRETVDADRAARAPADSVLEDAARYRWLREGNDAKHGAAWHVAVNLYGCEWDAAIDAARKQGANHD